MLRDAILSTLTYYDVLDMPLETHEIFRYLVRKDMDAPLFADVSSCINVLVHEGKIGQRAGYYYLFDREYLVPLRRRRYEISRRKWRSAYRIMRWLRAVPFVKIIFASGSLSLNNTDEQSDFDIIVVASHGRIWTTRLLVSGMLSMLGVRRTHDETVAPDKMCPNHFITDQSLAIPFRSMYTAQLYANLVPVVVRDAKLLDAFQKANSWVTEYLYRWEMDRSGMFHHGLSIFVQWMGERVLEGRIGDLIERRAAAWQRSRIERRPVPLKPGGHLTYTDDALAFHSQSSEGEIIRHYENHQSQLTHRFQ